MSEINKLVLKIQRRLNEKYSNSQTYFYTNKINQIVKEKRTSVNIFYEDIQYLLDCQENLKRWYQSKQYDTKMFTFKQYYFYHQDCPRIFAKYIEEAYAKWQDKKRDHIYKKLKLVYNQSDSSSPSSRMDDQKSQNYVAVSHFLLQISDYNPYSKKYYLRVQAKRQKEKKKEQEQKKNMSKRDLQFLNHELSAMLNDMSQISQISTISHESSNKFQKFKNQKFIVRNPNKSQQKYSSNSTNLSSSNSIVKFNFKKQKESSQKLNIIKQNQNLRLTNHSRQKDSFPQAQRISPKYNSGNLNIDAQLTKSKSIFSVSSFGLLNKQVSDLKNMNPKRQPLRLGIQSKKQNIAQQTNPKYNTEKKKQSSLPKNVVIKTKSTSKFEPRQSVEKLKVKQISLGKTKTNEFSDKKLTNYESDMRLRSLKSQFIGSTQSKKMFSSTKPHLERTYLNNIVHQKGKRLLQLKI